MSEKPDDQHELSKEELSYYWNRLQGLEARKEWFPSKDTSKEDFRPGRFPLLGQWFRPALAMATVIALGVILFSVFTRKKELLLDTPKDWIRTDGIELPRTMRFTMSDAPTLTPDTATFWKSTVGQSRSGSSPVVSEFDVTLVGVSSNGTSLIFRGALIFTNSLDANVPASGVFTGEVLVGTNQLAIPFSQPFTSALP